MQRHRPRGALRRRAPLASPTAPSLRVSVDTPCILHRSCPARGRDRVLELGKSQTRSSPFNCHNVVVLCVPPTSNPTGCFLVQRDQSYYPGGELEIYEINPRKISFVSGVFSVACPRLIRVLVAVIMLLIIGRRAAIGHPSETFLVRYKEREVHVCVLNPPIIRDRPMIWWILIPAVQEYWSLIGL
eukprot:sb/3471339/